MYAQVRDFSTDFGYVHKAGKPIRVTVSCGTNLSMLVTKLLPGTEYTDVVVRARNANGKGQVAALSTPIVTTGAGKHVWRLAVSPGASISTISLLCISSRG